MFNEIKEELTKSPECTLLPAIYVLVEFRFDKLLETMIEFEKLQIQIETLKMDDAELDQKDNFQMHYSDVFSKAKLLLSDTRSKSINNISANNKHDSRSSIASSSLNIIM